MFFTLIFHPPMTSFMTLRLLLLFLLLSACNEQDKGPSPSGAYLSLDGTEKLYPPPTPKLVKKDPYPWEERFLGSHPKITKEFFRCQGNRLNPPKITERANKERYSVIDCEGGNKHGLPFIGNQEGVYPILLDILNFLQNETGCRLVITCGHSCPAHNEWALENKEDMASKHMIGAEVDFYLEGMEERPKEVVDLIKSYYQRGQGDGKEKKEGTTEREETTSQKHSRHHEDFVSLGESANRADSDYSQAPTQGDPAYKIDPAYTVFKRYEGKTNASIKPWFNKEIFIKILESHEGRDPDNLHAFPYISLQVRYDRALKKRVVFTWEQARRYRRS